MRKVNLPQLDCSARCTKWFKHQWLQDALIAVESIGNKTIDENFDNNNSLWDFVEYDVVVFVPLQEDIIKFQADYMHYGNFNAQWLKCKMLTSKNYKIMQPKVWGKKIGNKVLESIEKRTSKLLENESLNSCLLLDSII